MVTDLTGCNRNAARQMLRNSIARADHDQRIVTYAHAAQKLAHVHFAAVPPVNLHVCIDVVPVRDSFLHLS